MSNLERTMRGHTHAQLMAEYAEVAKTNEKPWEEFVYQLAPGRGWTRLYQDPSWHTSTQYRRKPRTININGHEISAPFRGEMRKGQVYFAVELPHKALVYCHVWSDSSYDHRTRESGFIHVTEEAALAHAKALLSFTEVSSDE
jgi:hypothetical protein